MGKDKFKKRKERKRLIRAELLRRDILVRDIAEDLGISMVAVYKGMMTGSARVKEALIAAGVPERLFKQAPSPQPKSPLTPLYKGGEGEGDKDRRPQEGGRTHGSAPTGKRA